MRSIDTTRGTRNASRDAERARADRVGLTDCQPAAMLGSVAQKLPPLSDQVRTAIDGSGLSRRRICADIGLDEASMSKFMAGERGLSMQVLDRLGLYLGLALRPVKPAKPAKGA